MIKFSLLISLFCSYSIFSQCGGNISLSTWIQEGPAASGNWSVNAGGTSVTQSINGQPTMFVSPDDYINVRIKGKFRVDVGSGDNDFMGFVFGYKSPNVISGPNECDFYLFDWKQEFQVVSGVTADEGFSLSKIDTNINLSNAAANYPVFWDQEDVGINRTNLGKYINTTLGWNYSQTYDFELTFTYSKIIIKIDNDTIFDVNGCFQPGRFGFYNYSQPDVTYSDFSYELIYDFYVPPTITCIGDTSVFNAVSDTCFYALQDTSIALWNWDFGDGNSSTDTVGIHPYSAPGLYTVTLVVEDVNGCRDTTTQTVDIKPKPSDLDLADTLEHCFDNGGLVLDAGIWNSYLWYDNTVGQYNTVFQEGDYRITVFDQFGCDVSDEIAVVEFCPAELLVPNVFSPNNDFQNDSLTYFEKHIFGFDFTIYNRWGELVYQTDDINMFWDGKNINNDKEVSDGTYYWFAKYKDKKQQEFEQKGNVTVFRNK